MAIFNISFFITSAIALFLGFFVYSKNPRSNLHKSWLFLSTTTALFCFFYQLHLSASTHGLAVLWSKLLALGAVPTSFSFLLFVANLSRNVNKARIFIRFSLLGMIFFLWSVVFTDLFFKGVEPNDFFEYYAVAGKLFPLYIAYYLVNVAVSYWLAFDRLHQSITAVERSTIKATIFASLVGFGAGGCTFAPMYNLPALSFLTILMPIYPIIFSLAILRGRFLDIEVMIKRTAVFAGLFAFSYGVFAIFTFVGQALFERYFGWNRWTSMAPTICIIVITFQPLRNFLIKITDKYLFQKDFNPVELLKLFSRDILTELDLNKIVQGTKEIINNTIHPEYFSIYLYDTTKRHYMAHGETPHHDLEDGSKLIDALNQSDKPILIEGNRAKNHVAQNDVREEMKRLKMVLALPLKHKNSLLGFMLFGKKKSDEEYSQLDVEILSNLAIGETIAVANAQANEELAKIKTLENLGAMADSMSHQVNNRFHTITMLLGDLDDYIHYMYEEKFDSQSTEERFKSFQEIVQKAHRDIKDAVANAERGGVIAKAMLLKTRYDKFDDEEVDISKALELGLVFVSFKHKQEFKTITIKEHIEPALPKVYGKLAILQDIFANPVDNAVEAILIKKEGDKTNTEEGKIDVYVNHDRARDWITIRIEDNGNGMTPKELESVNSFVPYFTTKGSSSKKSGFGAGIHALAHFVIKILEGKLWYESTKGVGTVCHIEFPARREKPKPIEETGSQKGT